MKKTLLVTLGLFFVVTTAGPHCHPEEDDDDATGDDDDATETMTTSQETMTTPVREMTTIPRE